MLPLKNLARKMLIKGSPATVLSLQFHQHQNLRILSVYWMTSETWRAVGAMELNTGRRTL